MTDINGDFPFAMAHNPHDARFESIIDYIQIEEYADIIAEDEDIYALYVSTCRHVASLLLERGCLNESWGGRVRFPMALSDEEHSAIIRKLNHKNIDIEGHPIGLDCFLRKCVEFYVWEVDAK